LPAGLDLGVRMSGGGFRSNCRERAEKVF
jgi:hypothetical protein